MLCPQCGDEGRLYIDDVKVTVQVIEDGAEQVGDMVWDDSNPAHCSCGWVGTVDELDAIRRQIVVATEDALEAFWAVIARSFPTAKSGDLSPLATVRFQEFAKGTVREWVGLNVPEDAGCV